jgi:hypothetical protein
VTDLLGKARDTVRFYYRAAQALEFVSQEEFYGQYVGFVQSNTRNLMDDSPEELQQMAMMARNTAVHYWQADAGLTPEQREEGTIGNVNS